jgi:hypothetical protein
MTDLNIESLSREFCKLAEICIHEIAGIHSGGIHCKKCGLPWEVWTNLPDLSDTRELLKAIKKLGKAISFLAYLVSRYTTLVNPCKTEQGRVCLLACRYNY